MTIIADADLKAHLKPGSISGTQHDTTIANAVTATNAAVMKFCGRSFEKVAVASETARTYSRVDEGSWRGIESATSACVHDIWDTTNLVVKTDEDDDGVFETTWASTDYQLEPLNMLDGDSYSPYWRIRAVDDRTFPTGNKRAALQVTAAWGWTAVPGDVKQGALIKAARIWTRNESPLGVAGFGEMGAVRISRFEDPDVVDLLQWFRHPKLVALVG
jgi:hypothetical protein